MLQDFHDFVGQPLLAAQVDDLQVGPHGFGQHTHAGSEVVGLRGQPLGPGGAPVVAVAAPEIEFVGELRADVVGGQAEPVGENDAGSGLFPGTQPQFLQLRADTGVGGAVEVVDPGRGLEQGKHRGPGDACPRPGLIDPGDRPGQVEVRGEHLLDYPVEDRVGEGLPPLQGLVRAGSFTSGELRRQLGNRLENRGDLFGRKGAGGDEAGGNYRQPQSRYGVPPKIQGLM